MWYRKHSSLLNIYREIFICKMHTCTVRFKYFCFFEASACIFKLFFDWKRSYGWLESWEGLLFVTDNTCGSHLQSQVIAWLCRQTVVWVVNNCKKFGQVVCQCVLVSCKLFSLCPRLECIFMPCFQLTSFRNWNWNPLRWPNLRLRQKHSINAHPTSFALRLYFVRSLDTTVLIFAY